MKNKKPRKTKNLHLFAPELEFFFVQFFGCNSKKKNAKICVRPQPTKKKIYKKKY